MFKLWCFFFYFDFVPAPSPRPPTCLYTIVNKSIFFGNITLLNYLFMFLQCLYQFLLKFVGKKGKYLWWLNTFWTFLVHSLKVTDRSVEFVTEPIFCLSDNPLKRVNKMPLLTFAVYILYFNRKEKRYWQQMLCHVRESW